VQSGFREVFRLDFSEGGRDLIKAINEIGTDIHTNLTVNETGADTH